MNRDDLIRELRRYSRKARTEFAWNPRKGKGGHGELRVGDKFTTVKSGELTRVYIEVVLKQLGLDKDVL